MFDKLVISYETYHLWISRIRWCNLARGWNGKTGPRWETRWFKSSKMIWWEKRNKIKIKLHFICYASSVITASQIRLFYPKVIVSVFVKKENRFFYFQGGRCNGLGYILAIIVFSFAYNTGMSRRFIIFHDHCHTCHCLKSLSFLQSSFLSWRQCTQRQWTQRPIRHGRFYIWLCSEFFDNQQANH